MDYQAKMMKAISEVLETMFFLSIDFEDRNASGQVGLCEARIELCLDGTELGIALRVADDFARQAAANFLGVDEDKVGEAEVMDVLREMANMVGGTFIQQVGDSNSCLGIPKFSRFQSDSGEIGEGLQFTCMGDFAGVVSWDRPVSG